MFHIVIQEKEVSDKLTAKQFNHLQHIGGSCDSSNTLRLPDTASIQTNTDDLAAVSFYPLRVHVLKVYVLLQIQSSSPTNESEQHTYTSLYWEPASERNELYYQLKRRLYLDIVGGTIE